MTLQRCALITGATGKLGYHIAHRLAQDGWALVLTSRSESRAKSLADEMRASGSPDVRGVVLDFLDKDSPKDIGKQLANQGVRVTHIVNNARSLVTLEVGQDGITPHSSFVGEIEIDVIGPYHLTMAIAQDSQHALSTVVNIGSQYGVVAPNPALYEGSLNRSPIQYGVAKAALHHLTREMAVRLSPRVRVNCVAFGGFAGRASEEFVSRYSQMVPSGRMLKDSEVAGPVAFLLSEDSASVNGHVLIADGGWSIW